MKTCEIIKMSSSRDAYPFVVYHRVSSSCIIVANHRYIHAHHYFDVRTKKKKKKNLQTSVRIRCVSVYRVGIAHQLGWAKASLRTYQNVVQRYRTNWSVMCLFYVVTKAREDIEGRCNNVVEKQNKFVTTVRGETRSGGKRVSEKRKFPLRFV
jgi:hypothetical protein